MDRSSAAEDFRVQLIDSLGDGRPLREFHGLELLVLCELGTKLLTVERSAEHLCDRLDMRTFLCTDVPDGLAQAELLGQLNGMETLNRWVGLADGLVMVASSLALGDPKDPHSLRLAKFLLETQVSRARAALFAGVPNLLEGQPFLIGDDQAGYVREEEAHPAVHSLEQNVLPFGERDDLWPSRLDQLRRGQTLALPPFGAYQGPGWLGFMTPTGACIQVPWTSVEQDYGVFEIRPDRFLSYSHGETTDIELSTNVWHRLGAGLELSAHLPVRVETPEDDLELATLLNRALLNAQCSSGIGQFLPAADGVRYRAFLPAALAVDEPFALWLLERVIVSMAVQLQEVRPIVEGGAPPPTESLSTAPI